MALVGFVVCLHGAVASPKVSVPYGPSQAPYKPVSTPNPLVSTPNQPKRSCPNCGAQLSADAKFCPDCGNNLIVVII